MLLALVLVTTLGSFLSSTGSPRCRPTIGRSALAFVVPVLWALLIVFLPAGVVAAVLRNESIWPVLLILFVLGAPAMFVATIVVWVDGALTGDLQDSLRSLPHRLGKRSRDRP